MRYRLSLLLLAILLAGIIPQASAFAQDQNPSFPAGNEYLFLPRLDRQKDRPFAVPVPVIINGGVQAADVDSAFCGDYLEGNQVTASTSKGQCLAGPRIGLASSGYGVTNLSWENFSPHAFGGTTTNVQDLAMNTSIINLGGISFDVEPLDFAESDIQAFRLILSTNEVQGASVSQDVGDLAALLVRLTRMTTDIAELHPLPVPEDTPVYARYGKGNVTLRICHPLLEGKRYWNWYPIYFEIEGTGDSIKMGGWWGPNTAPLEYNTLSACMGPVWRYLGWETFLKPEAQAWRESILNEADIPLRGVYTYSIPEWNDDLGGQWTITIASMGAGAFMFWQYVNHAGEIVVGATNAVFVVPTRALVCTVNPAVCTVKGTSAAAAENIPSR